MRRFARFVLVVVAAGALTAATVALVAPQVGSVLAAHESSPVDTIDLVPLSQRSYVYDATGRRLAVLHGDENRAEIALGDVPQEVVDTVLAVEDTDFYEHNGINLRAATRALFTNVKAGDVRQGGSTITQQLVKNALLDADQSLDRKVKEAVLAVRLEDQLSKDEILERYLNTVYLGNTAYGLQAAAETYFGKNANELTRADAALLAGLIRNPVGYDPFRDPELALERREVVIDRLLELGEIDEAEAKAIRETPLPAARHSVLPKPNDYFVNEVIRRLIDDERLGATQNERYNLLFRGGLTIKTTVDLALQMKAVAALAELPESEFTSAIVAVEPGTGAVRALVGGKGFEDAKYNIATQGVGRQAGSSFKPFVLAAALESGISPRSTINGGGPCVFEGANNGEDYEVENFEGSRGGPGDLIQQIKRSSNCAFVRLGLIVGNDKVVRLAERAGITTPLAPVASTPLGTNEVRPLDMAAAFATFANDGVYVEPVFVTEVLDRDGNVIFRAEPNERRAVSVETAGAVTDALAQNVTGGTGTRARFRDGRPAAGKTGTTQNHHDAWFVGYTPQLATAVWMGHHEALIPMRNVGGVARVTGGSWPARVWQAFMGPALDGVPIVRFAPPPRYDRGEPLRLPGEKEPVVERRSTTTSSTVPGEDDGDDDEPTDETTTTSTPPEEQPPDTTGNGNGNGNGNGGGGDDVAPATEGVDSGQTDGSG